MNSILADSFEALLPFLFIFAISLLSFAKLCHSLYGDLDEPGVYVHDFFLTFGSSVRTIVKLALMQDWNSIIFAISFYTSFASAILFVIFTFFFALLAEQLILGMIIRTYEHTVSCKSRRVHATLQPFFQSLDETQQEALLQDFLIINVVLWDLHTIIDTLTQPRSSPINIHNLQSVMRVQEKDTSSTQFPQSTTSLDTQTGLPMLLTECPEGIVAKEPLCLTSRPSCCHGDSAPAIASAGL